MPYAEQRRAEQVVHAGLPSRQRSKRQDHVHVCLHGRGAAQVHPQHLEGRVPSAAAQITCTSAARLPRRACDVQPPAQRWALAGLRRLPEQRQGRSGLSGCVALDPGLRKLQVQALAGGHAGRLLAQDAAVPERALPVLHVLSALPAWAAWHAQRPRQRQRQHDRGPLPRLRLAASLSTAGRAAWAACRRCSSLT